MERPSEAEFLKRVEQHGIEVLRDDGLYRHLRYRGQHGSVDGFDLVTWPGFLCYCGDMGDYLFTRCEDMLKFFRQRERDARLRINTDYWSEKVVADDRDGIKNYSPDVFRRIVREWVDDQSDEVKAAVENDVLRYADDGEYAARQAANDFEHDGDLLFQDFYEADATEYSYRFVFACYAIVWGIRQYDDYYATKGASNHG